MLGWIIFLLLSLCVCLTRFFFLQDMPTSTVWSIQYYCICSDRFGHTINIEGQCIRTSPTSFHGTLQEHVVRNWHDYSEVIFLTHSNIVYWHAWQSASWKLAFHAVIQSHLCVVIINGAIHKLQQQPYIQHG